MTTHTGVAGYRLLTEASGAVAMPRDLVVCRGADTITFLHSLLSQDVAGMTAGEARWSFLLQPTGKLVALLRVHRLADPANPNGAVVLDADPGAGDVVLAALTRFRIRTKCELELIHGGLQAWRGPSTAAGPVAVAPTVDQLTAGEAQLHIGAGPWWGSNEFDVVGVGVLDIARNEADPAMFDVVRIERGVPVFGRELTDATIPNETGLVGAAVSRTKGCYLGQELVERIDSRGGNTPHRLCRLDLQGDVVPPDQRAVLSVAGKDLGVLTSAARHPLTGRVVGLGSVHRTVDPGATVEVLWETGADTAIVRKTPGPA
jgi:tRNA-modifying protein YgfZ